MEEIRRLIVYQAYNAIDGKVYVGATRNSIKQRKLDHLERAERGQKGKLYEAFRNYGSEAFIWQTIDTAESINELAKKEKYWIKYYDSKANGYNSDEGGGFKKTAYQYSVTTRELLEEFEDLNSAASACNASKQDISRAALGVSNLYNGYLWSYQKFDKLPELNDKRTRRVVQYDMDGNRIAVFVSVAQASCLTGVSKTCIARVCRGERGFSKGFKWSYN